MFAPFVYGTIVLMPIMSYLSDKKIVSKAENSCHMLLGIGLVATILNLYLFIWIDKEFTLFNTITKYVAECHLCVF